MKAKKLLIVFSLFCSFALFSIVTYSWISRSWTPELEYSQVSISTTGALIITLVDDEGNESLYEDVNLNSYIGINEFVLKQVSSPDGKYFVSANFTPVLGGGEPIYDENVDEKYIETEFWLKTQYETDEDLRNKKKEIFLSSESYIRYTGTDGDSDSVELTIRVSIEIEDLNDNKPYIFCVDRGDNNKQIYSDELWATKLDSVGKEVFVDYPDDRDLNTDNCEKVANVYRLDYFDGSTPDRVLFTMTPADVQKVTVRIWLEGCDENCLTEIAGKNLSILLKFDSREVEAQQENE